MLFESLATPSGSPLSGPVSYRDGVHVEVSDGQSLWCDAARQRELCFVGSAAGLAQLHLSEALLCSERSWRLHSELSALSERAIKKPPSLLLSPTGRPFQLGAARFELFPSGQLPGAAALWLRTARGAEIVYAGAPNPCPRQTVETMQVRAAETLIVHAPLALQSTPLPSRSEALQALQTELAAGLAESAISVVLCSALSTAPELVVALRTEPLLRAALNRQALVAHSQILRVCTAYRRIAALPDHLPADAPGLRRHGGAIAPGSVLLWPLSAAVTPLAALAKAGAGHPPLRILLCSGAALLPSFVDQLGQRLSESGLSLQAALPFPDAIDQPGLSALVRETGCRRVFLTAGSSAALATALAPASCQPLGPPNQLPLF